MNAEAAKVGFDALNVVPCMALHGLVQNVETKDSVEFRFLLDLI
jgi:hypothetical protein